MTTTMKRVWVLRDDLPETLDLYRPLAGNEKGGRPRQQQRLRHQKYCQRHGGGDKGPEAIRAAPQWAASRQLTGSFSRRP